MCFLRKQCRGSYIFRVQWDVPYAGVDLGHPLLFQTDSEGPVTS